MPLPVTDIIFEVPTFDGKPIKCELIPLKQKIAGYVFHTCAMQLISSVSGAVSTKGGQVEKISGFIKELSKVDYEVLWNLAEYLCKDAVIGGKEIQSLDDCDIITQSPWALYLIIFHGVKGNWPRVFFELETKLKGFVSIMKTEMAKQMKERGIDPDSLFPSGNSKSAPSPDSTI